MQYIQYFDFSSYPVTYGIMAVNIMIFVLINLKVLKTSQLGSSYITSLQERQYYRIITAAFTQQEFLHLACNMYSLYNIGRVLEHALKSRIYAICYGTIMIVGGITSARIHKKSSPFVLCIGASGVICGLIGVYVVIAYSVMGFSAIRSMAPTFVILALMTTSKKIDSIGHFAGLFTGIIAGFILINL